MKYVHQRNHGAWFVKDGKEVQIRDYAVEEPLLDFWLTYASRGGRPELIAEDMPHGAFFDPGGMVSTTEPRVCIEVNGQKLGAWLRGLDTLVPLLRRTRQWADNIEGPPHCRVWGRWCSVLLTVETALAAADAFEAEYARREDEAGEQELRVDLARAAAGVVDGRALGLERHP